MIGKNQRPQDPLPPAFASARETWAFAGLLLLLCALPRLLAACDLPDQEDVYAGAPLEIGGVDFLREQIFEEEGEVDIAFVGGSLSWVGVNAPLVAEALSAHLGRPARVLNLGVNWRSEDKYWVILRDLVERRRVRLVVLSTPHSRHAGIELGHDAYRWTTQRDLEQGMGEGLSPRHRLALEAANVLGAPRHLLSCLRDNRPAPARYASSAGWYGVELNFKKPGDDQRSAWNDAELDLEAPALAPEVMLNGDYSGARANDYQRHFLRKLDSLLALHGTRLALLTPTPWVHRHDGGFDCLTEWTVAAERPPPMISAPGSLLYAGLGEQQLTQLYYDEWHLNRRGSTHFTHAVLPALLKVYDDAQAD